MIYNFKLQKRAQKLFLDQILKDQGDFTDQFAGNPAQILG